MDDHVGNQNLKGSQLNVSKDPSINIIIIINNIIINITIINITIINITIDFFIWPLYLGSMI